RHVAMNRPPGDDPTEHSATVFVFHGRRILETFLRKLLALRQRLLQPGPLILVERLPDRIELGGGLKLIYIPCPDDRPDQPRAFLSGTSPRIPAAENERGRGDRAKQRG